MDGYGRSHEGIGIGVAGIVARWPGSRSVSEYGLAQDGDLFPL